jgi:hypothetical protein
MSEQDNCEEGIPAHRRDSRLREVLEFFRYGNRSTVSDMSPSLLLLLVDAAAMITNSKS